MSPKKHGGPQVKGRRKLIATDNGGREVTLEEKLKSKREGRRETETRKGGLVCFTSKTS